MLQYLSVHIHVNEDKLITIRVVATTLEKLEWNVEMINILILKTSLFWVYIYVY